MNITLITLRDYQIILTVYLNDLNSNFNIYRHATVPHYLLSIFCNLCF